MIQITLHWGSISLCADTSKGCSTNSSLCQSTITLVCGLCPWVPELILASGQHLFEGSKGHKCQTLTFLDTSEKYMQRNGKCFIFTLTEHFKQDRSGKAIGNIRLYKYPVKKLCVHETLNHYLRVTKNLMNSTRLFVSYIKPYRAVTPSTIGRWIKSILGQARINTELFTAHSTRSASTSKAASTVYTDVILATTGLDWGVHISQVLQQASCRN